MEERLVKETGESRMREGKWRKGKGRGEEWGNGGKAREGTGARRVREREGMGSKENGRGDKGRGGRGVEGK